MKLPDDFPFTQSQAESIFRVVLQIEQAVLCFIRDGEHKRILHLAIRAKKRRTQKKNRRRAACYIMKEVKKHEN